MMNYLKINGIVSPKSVEKLKITEIILFTGQYVVGIDCLDGTTKESFI